MNAQPVLTPAGTPYIEFLGSEIDPTTLFPGMGWEYLGVDKKWDSFPCSEKDPHAWSQEFFRNATHSGRTSNIKYRRVVGPGVLTKIERNLLLYLETRAVDHGGLILRDHMNADDLAIAQHWNEVGFIQFSRVPFKLIRSGLTHAVILSDAAHWLAGQERQRRSKTQPHKLTKSIFTADTESDEEE